MNFRSSEATNFAAIQQFLKIVRKEEAQYYAYKSPLLVPILDEINPVNPIPPYLSKTHFNIIHPPTSLSS
jgi:hypothetical protein